MSAAWDNSTAVIADDEKRSKRLIRLWGYLSVAGLFLIYVAAHCGVNLF